MLTDPHVLTWLPSKSSRLCFWCFEVMHYFKEFIMWFHDRQSQPHLRLLIIFSRWSAIIMISILWQSSFECQGEIFKMIPSRYETYSTASSFEKPLCQPNVKSINVFFSVVNIMWNYMQSKQYKQCHPWKRILEKRCIFWRKLCWCQ